MSVSTPSFKKQAWVLFSGLALFQIILLLPTPQDMTVPAHRLMAVVALMAVWWLGEGTSLAATALLPLVLFPLLGIMPSKEVAPNYTNHLIFLFLGGFMIALAMEKWNFHKRLALRIILAVGTGIPQMVFGFMAASAFLSMWISNTATTMMMLPVAMAVVRQVAAQATLNGERGTETEKVIRETLGLVLMLGLAYSASIGGVGTLIGTPPNIVFAGFYKKLFPELPEVTFSQWMIAAVPIVLLMLPLVWFFLCRFVSPVPLHSIRLGGKNPLVIQNELKALGKINQAEKIIAVVFVLTALLWIFRKPITLGGVTLPGWSAWFPYSTFLHDATVAMAMGILLMVFPLGFGRGLERLQKREYFVLDWKTVENGVPWGILLLFGGGFALAAGFGRTGLDHWMGQHLGRMVGFPLWIVVPLICLGITFLTELTSNTATTTMILPIIAAAAVAADVHPLLLMVPTTVAASFAFMLPVATPPNAIVFSSGWVTIPQMSRAGLILNFLGVVMITGMILLIVPHLLL